MTKLMGELSAETIKELGDIVSLYPEVDKVVLFGSWALGNAKTGSDIDLALYGEHVTSQIVSKFHYHLEEETLLPWMFDVVHYERLKNKDLKEHIDHHGKVIFQRKSKVIMSR